MKLRTYKTEMLKVLLWYTERVTEKFLYAKISPATQELASLYLLEIQKYKMATEMNPAWHVPVKVLFFPQESRMEVAVTDESNVLYLDDF